MIEREKQFLSRVLVLLRKKRATTWEVSYVWTSTTKCRKSQNAQHLANHERHLSKTDYDFTSKIIVSTASHRGGRKSRDAANSKTCGCLPVWDGMIDL